MSDTQQDKAGENTQATQPPKVGVSVSNPTSVEEEAKKKLKIQKAIKQFVQQIKVGCNKQICFSKYCRKNIFGKSLFYASPFTRRVAGVPGQKTHQY